MAMGKEQDELQVGAHRFMDDDEAKHEAAQKEWEAAKQHRSSSDGEPVMSFAWFPAGEWTQARRRWTDLQDQELPEDHAAYSKVVESRIRGLSRDVGRNLRVAPITVEALEEYSRHHGLDPNTGEARAQFAAELTRLGQALDWPPGRNEPCWCGSGLKYKRCCATALDDRVR